jgi:hypothetical protein
MNCQRAAAILRGLEKNELVVEAHEIETMLSLGLAVEADPDDLAALQWLEPLVREQANRPLNDPAAPAALAEALRRTDEDLRSDWYRMNTAEADVARRDALRIAMRRALVWLGDRIRVERLSRIMADAPQVAPGVRYVCAPALGSEHYALTHKGFRARRQLKIRLERFGGASFKSFMAAFDKNEAKMRAFGAEVGALSQGIGHVRKNREQVVIGLAKSGVPAQQAVGAYHASLRGATPDAAVTCVRNATTFGSPQHAAERLRQAQAALKRAGIGLSPEALGASKSLLPFEPLEAGVQRFVELRHRLEQIFGRAPILFKFVSRLMPSAGTPAEAVGRVVYAGNLLQQMPSQVFKSPDPRPAAVALASMVRAPEALPALVTRFRELQHLLATSGVSAQSFIEADALECVACPGSVVEVVDTVSALITQVAGARRPERADVAVAVAFAKRFAL